MSATPMQTTAPSPGFSQARPVRLAYVDNLRSVMILLVFSMHAAVTYSPFGSWYFRDNARTSFGQAVALGSYQAFLQAFFMSLLFSIAGYFAQAALRRRGPPAFLSERARRLGIPLVVYMFVVGPLTQFYVAGSWRSNPPEPFAAEWLHHLRNGALWSGSGPLWFCLALLIFSIVLTVAPRSADADGAAPAHFPPPGAITAYMLVMAAVTFVVRLRFNNGAAVLNLQLGDFAQYILSFAAGILARRHGWLEALSTRAGLRWLAVGIVFAPLFWVALLIAGGALHGNAAAYGGGPHWQAAAKSLWEALVCVSMSIGLLALFRSTLNADGPLARFASANSFGAYVLHPPVLIGVTRLLTATDWAVPMKFAAATLAGAALTFALVAALRLARPVRAVLG